jgi:IS5 family transposase
MDEGSGRVRRAVVTPARTYESEVADALVAGDEKAVYGARAYEKKARRRALKARGIKDRIMHRRHKPIARLPHWQQVRNALIARRRAPVEAVFSALKRLSGGARALSQPRPQRLRPVGDSHRRQPAPRDAARQAAPAGCRRRLSPP